MAEAFARIEKALAQIDTRRASGQVTSVSGVLVRARIPAVRVGELCELREPSVGKIGLAEVVGIEGDTALLSLHGDTRGISLRTEVIPSRRDPSVPVGDHLVGCIIDAHGTILRHSSQTSANFSQTLQPLYRRNENPLSRKPVRRLFTTGITSIDAILTCGEGQRVGIFGSPGTGKSTLISHVINGSDTDIVVCALVGERGREVSEFVETNMPEGAISNSVLIVATSDRPALERYKAVLTATAIAEYFRDQGKRVLLIIDSITRMARALREIGLAAGEPPVRRGFPPSVFATLPQIFERSGNSDKGSITAFYTVLVEGADVDDPIAEETRSLLDGHIVLSDEIARTGHFPAIDILASRSRTMGAVTTSSQQGAASRLREMLAIYKDVELLIRVGEYKPGHDPVVDKAVTKNADIKAFLHDGRSGASFKETIEKLEALVQ